MIFPKLSQGHTFSENRTLAAPHYHFCEQPTSSVVSHVKYFFATLHAVLKCEIVSLIRVKSYPTLVLSYSSLKEASTSIRMRPLLEVVSRGFPLFCFQQK